MSERPIVVVVHSARRCGKTADMERACAELKARGFEVLEVEAKDEPMLLGWTRDYFRDLYLSARAAGDDAAKEGK